MKKFIKNTANSIRAKAIRLAATRRSTVDNDVCRGCHEHRLRTCLWSEYILFRCIPAILRYEYGRVLHLDDIGVIHFDIAKPVEFSCQFP